MIGSTQNLAAYGRQIFSGLKQISKLRLSSLRKVFSLMGRREKIALLALLILAAGNLSWSLRNLYYSATSAAPASGGLYIEGMLGQPAYINPLLAYQEADLALSRLVFSGLYKYDNQGNIVPDLAESLPTISEDQKQYSIKLRQNVRWHNDKPFSADDVIFTIQTLKDPAYKSPYRSLWLATSVEKISDHEVKFSTKDVSGPFIHNLTLPVLPQFVWSRVEPQNFLLSKNNLEAIGTGPYAVREIKKLASGKIQQITLGSYSHFYQGKPKLEKITVKFYDREEDLLNAFHSREILGFGYIPLGSTLYLEKSQENSQIFSIPLPQYQVLFLNLNSKALAEQEVRQALSLATDKQAIINEVFGGNALFPSSPLIYSRSSAGPAPAADPEKAAAILEAAGWKIEPASGIRAKRNTLLELSIVTNDSPLNSKTAEKIADSWRKIGAKVSLSVMQTKQLADSVIRPRNFDVLLFPLKTGADPDPFPFWHSSQIKDPGFNLTGFADQEADKLITQARTTTDKETRMEKYKALEELFREKTPAIFLDQTVYIYAVDKQVKNIGLSNLYEPHHRFYDITNWHIKEMRVWK